MIIKMISTTIKPIVPNPSNKKYLAELYFKAIAEREVIKRTIQRTPEPTEKDIIELLQLDKLVDELRNILGTKIETVP